MCILGTHTHSLSTSKKWEETQLAKFVSLQVCLPIKHEAILVYQPFDLMVQISPCISGALPCLSCTIQVLISIVFWRPQTGVVIIHVLVLVLIPVASEQPLYCILWGWLALRLHLIKYQLIHLLRPFQCFLQCNTSEKVTFENTNVILCRSTTRWPLNKKKTGKIQGKFPSSSFSKLTNRQKKAVIASHLVLCLIMGEIQNDGLRHRRKDFLLDSEFKIRGDVREMQVQCVQCSSINGSLTASACRCTLLRSKTSQTAHSAPTAALDGGTGGIFVVGLYSCSSHRSAFEVITGHLVLRQSVDDAKNLRTLSSSCCRRQADVVFWPRWQILKAVFRYRRGHVIAHWENKH